MKYQHLSANQPIGIFDSGVGGLTTAREIKRVMPQESFIYFGDTKHLPYGEKSKEAIIDYSLQITKFLLEQNCKAIVIACNTATSNALEEVKKMVNDKVFVFDVINPVAEKVAYEIHLSFKYDCCLFYDKRLYNALYSQRLTSLNKNRRPI